MKCPYCGAETQKDICEFCGSEIPKEKTSFSMDNRMAFYFSGSINNHNAARKKTETSIQICNHSICLDHIFCYRIQWNVR